MKLIIICIVTILFGTIVVLFFNRNNQQEKEPPKVEEKIKPTFARIELAHYRIKNDKVDFSSYFIIDSNGIFQSEARLYEGKEFSNYQLNDSAIKLLNELFNGEKPLREHMTVTELKQDEYYDGYNSYCAYVSLRTNKTDTLCFIPPFMSKSFNHLIESMYEQIIFSSRNIVNQPIKYDIQEVFDVILLANKKSPYLHNLETEPPANRKRDNLSPPAIKR